MRELSRLKGAGESVLRLLAGVVIPAGSSPTDSDETVDATIIFADIEGFSSLVAREGDDAAQRVLDALDVAIDRTVTDGGCRVVKRLGDGVMLVAANPNVAVSAAADMPDIFADAISGEAFSLRLRVGAHRGLVRRRGDDLIGYHVNVAARVAEQAEGGTTLITGALRDELTVADSLNVTSAGPLVAKGVPEQPPLYRVNREVHRSVTA